MPIRSHSLEELDRLPGRQLHDRLLPGGPAPDEATDAARLARHAHRAHRDHLHREELLHGTPDLVLVRARVDREGDEVLLLATEFAFLGHDLTADHVVGIHEPAPSRAARSASSSRCSTAATAPRVSSRWRWRSTSNTFSPSARITETPGRLRAEP